MKVIHKYSLVPGFSVVSLPKGATVLHVGEQLREIKLWALIDTDAPMFGTEFNIVATGEEINFPWNAWTYAGTVHQLSGSLVWHVWYKPNS